MEICGGTPSENVVVGNAYRRRPRDRFPADRSEAARRHRGAAAGDAAHPDPSRLRHGRQRPGREGRDPVLAHRRAGQGRHRRGNRAHRRRRQGADDAVRARRGRPQGGADADPAPHPPRQARARGARHDRGGDLVVHHEAGGRTVRRRQERTRARQPDRRRPFRHAAEPVARPDRSRAGQWRSRLCRCRAVRGRPDLQGRSPRGPVRRGRRHPPRLCVIEGHRPALVGFGRWPMCSTPRPMRLRCWLRPARRCRRCRSCRAGRAGCIRAVPARSRSARRTCSAISASCIRARWKRSAPTAR